MPSRLRAAVVGLGKAAQAQVQWLDRDERYEVVAGFDPDTRHACALGAPTFEDWGAFLKSGPFDIALLCGPSESRAAQALELASRGSSLICEKPVAVSLSGCDAIEEACAQAGTIAHVMFNMRQHRVIGAVCDLIPQISPIHHAEFEYTQNRATVGWRHRFGAAGGVLKEQGCHVIDLALRFLGPIEHVSSENLVVVPGREVEDHGVILARCCSGATLTIYSSWCDPVTEALHGRLIGQNGSLEFRLSPYDPALNRVIVHFPTGGEVVVPLRSPAVIDSVYPGLEDATARTMQLFLDCVAAGTPSECTIEDARSGLEVVLASYLAQATTRLVELPLEHDIDLLEDFGQYRSFDRSRTPSRGANL